jgi:hypothetical protein
MKRQFQLLFLILVPEETALNLGRNRGLVYINHIEGG